MLIIKRLIEALIMKRLFFLLLAILNFSISGVAQNNQRVKDSLITALSLIEQQGYINGFQVGIVTKDRILFTGGFGYANKENNTRYTDNTIQPVASISKTFIGVALLKAQELGVLQLDDPINKHLPFDVINPHFIDSEITIRQLATHTSSIKDSKAYWKKTYVLEDSKKTTTGKVTSTFNDANTKMPLSTFLKKILNTEGSWYSRKTFDTSRPGELFEYSNTGAALAAYIIEVATGQPFSLFTKTYIFDSLGMNNSGWSYGAIDIAKHSTLYTKKQKALANYTIITYPDGGLRTTAIDLSSFLQELMSGYLSEGTLLSIDSYKELFTQQLEGSQFTERDKKNPYNDEYNMGIFMGFSAKGYVGHTGGDPGVASYMFFNPSTHIGRILIVNTDLEDKGIGAFYEIWNTLEKFQDKF